ncbi:hypothetical protein [Paenibacillus sp. P36]|uniref:hypothetical protein n=1 Tax=Paenibacillus sp. P36 TaxID=3342538 RepID=UPI0038B3DC92
MKKLFVVFVSIVILFTASISVSASQSSSNMLETKIVAIDNTSFTGSSSNEPQASLVAAAKVAQKAYVYGTAAVTYYGKQVVTAAVKGATRIFGLPEGASDPEFGIKDIDVIFDK